MIHKQKNVLMPHALRSTFISPMLGLHVHVCICVTNQINRAYDYNGCRNSHMLCSSIDPQVMLEEANYILEVIRSTSAEI